MSGVSVVPPDGPPLLSSVDPPPGATLKEVSVWYQAPDGEAILALFKKPLDGPVGGDPANPTPLASINPLATGAGTLQATLTVNEVIDGSATYPLVVFVSSPSQEVAGIRYGYVAPPQAFVPKVPLERRVDTRLSSGKLQPGEERLINLGVPSLMRAAVINLTVTETEQAGYVAVFPADSTWSGTSSVNWSNSDQNVANTVITATDSDGRIIIRCGPQATHVVIDVEGYSSDRCPLFVATEAMRTHQPHVRHLSWCHQSLRRPAVWRRPCRPGRRSPARTPPVSKAGR